MAELVVALSALASAFLALGLVYVTWRYARETKSIAEATRKQADASVEMAQEMREQRMALDRPNLLIDFQGTTPPNRPYVAGEREEELADFPKELSFGVYNDGPGPAKGLSVAYKDFLPKGRDYLLSKEKKWGCVLNNRSLIPFLEAAGVIERNSDWAVGAIVVKYSDVHDRRWEAHLELHEIREATGNMEEPNEMCLYIESGEQHTLGPYPPEAQQ